MWLRMPKGCDSVTHGQDGYIVSNLDWTVEVPDEVGRFMLQDGKSGAVLIEDEPEPELLTCPKCGHTFSKG